MCSRGLDQFNYLNLTLYDKSSLFYYYFNSVRCAALSKSSMHFLKLKLDAPDWRRSYFSHEHMNTELFMTFTFTKMVLIEPFSIWRTENPFPRGVIQHPRGKSENNHGLFVVEPHCIHNLLQLWSQNVNNSNNNNNKKKNGCKHYCLNVEYACIFCNH